MKVIKKDGTYQDWDKEKIREACKKASERVMTTLKEEDYNKIFVEVEKIFVESEEVSVSKIHKAVEKVLCELYPKVGESYCNYRNYKIDFVKMLDDVYKKVQSIYYIGDKSNANTNSAMVSTRRSLSVGELNKELYKKFFLTTEELQAANDGYIYIHDMKDRRDTVNCCLFDMEAVLKDGFYMGDMFYNEPKSLDTAFDVMSDVILATAAQQYGGFTVPEIDKILSPYAEKSYNNYVKEYREIASSFYQEDMSLRELEYLADVYATEKVQREMEQGWQGLEYKLNTVASSRGDYPFVTVTFGLATDFFGRMASITALNVHSKGQGKIGHKRHVLFPKYVFLYDEELHGVGCVNEDVFEAGIDCSSKAMYPDWLSLSGEGYVAEIYKKYGRVISPMGCRAFLSPWYERGGMEPQDEDDKPIFNSRFNMGVVSLHLPMILAKAKEEKKDFYEVLDFYLELSRNLHKRTYEYIGEFKASNNPLAYCEGGFLGGRLQPNEKIKSILPAMTMSFGITALNELQQLYNGKSIAEDGNFALEVMEYINNYVNRIKYEDNILYAIYGTPAESLCGLQIEQFRKKYGIIENVSDKDYVSNSFHCHVTENITPIQKQDYEERFWNYFNGGKIQYCRYPIGYNKEAIRTLVKRAMIKGFYEGVNLELSYCGDCGYQSISMGNSCDKCGSTNITEINRMNGYLGYSRISGDTKYNKAKMTEIRERKSM